jgi:hypothetical protein
VKNYQTNYSPTEHEQLNKLFTAFFLSGPIHTDLSSSAHFLNVFEEIFRPEFSLIVAAKQCAVNDKNSKLVESLIGKNVVITGKAGKLSAKGEVLRTKRGKTVFQCVNTGGGKVAFKYGPSFISVPIMGKEGKQKLAWALLACTSLVPQLLPIIVGYCLADNGTGVDKKRGFSYQPARMTTVLTSSGELDPNTEPGACEVFDLVPQSGDNIGIRTSFGSYLRAPSWSGSVLQSPHCRGDELFQVRVART